jgi:hypothetical protein
LKETKMSALRKLPPSLDRFEPVLPLAKAKARELLDRGGKLVSVSRDKVLVERCGQRATIDAMGRVSWQTA